MDERNYLDTMGGADMKLNDKQKEQLGYLLAKRGEKLSLDPVKRKRQINYYIKMLDNRAKEKLDQTPAYMDKDDDKPAVRMMDEQKIRRIIRKLVKEAVAKKAK
jgi:dsDNA-binding SOS-regulon protein